MNCVKLLFSLFDGFTIQNFKFDFFFIYEIWLVIIHLTFNMHFRSFLKSTHIWRSRIRIDRSELHAKPLLSKHEVRSLVSMSHSRSPECSFLVVQTFQLPTILFSLSSFGVANFKNYVVFHFRRIHNIRCVMAIELDIHLLIIQSHLLRAINAIVGGEPFALRKLTLR